MIFLQVIRVGRLSGGVIFEAIRSVFYLMAHESESVHRATIHTFSVLEFIVHTTIQLIVFGA